MQSMGWSFTEVQLVSHGGISFTSSQEDCNQFCSFPMDMELSQFVKHEQGHTSVESAFWSKTILHPL